MRIAIACALAMVLTFSLAFCDGCDWPDPQFDRGQVVTVRISGEKVTILRVLSGAGPAYKCRVGSGFVYFKEFELEEIRGRSK